MEVYTFLKSFDHLLLNYTPLDAVGLCICVIKMFYLEIEYIETIDPMMLINADIVVAWLLSPLWRGNQSCGEITPAGCGEITKSVAKLPVAKVPCGELTRIR